MTGILLVSDQRISEIKRSLDIKIGSGWDYWCLKGAEKYGDAFWYAEKAKFELRRQNLFKLPPRRRNDDFDFTVRERDNAIYREFWETYQAINDEFIPEDPVYSGTRAGITLATTADAWTYSSPASGQSRVLESYIGGESTVSTVLRLAVQRATGGTTATNQTPEKMSTRSPNGVGTFATTWTAQPTLSGTALLFHAFNTFGGTDRWVSAPGEEIYQVNGEILSARSSSGTPVISSHMVYEEL
jgi:hypothetical protein